MTGEALMAVDGNSLLHRSFHALAGSNHRNASGDPIWAVRGLLSQLVTAAERIGPERIVVGFDDPDRNARRERWPHYKAQRADKLPTLVSQLAQASEVLTEIGIHVVTPEAQEADDVLASAARWANQRGQHCVIVTSDRDAFCLINDQTTVLRVINGGVDASPMLTPDRLQLMLGIRPEQYADFAAFRGDASDNLPGVPGIGPKRALALLTGIGTGSEIFADAAAGGERVAGILSRTWADRLADPQSHSSWQQNRQVMQMRDDLPLGLTDATESGLLPYDEATVHRVLHSHQLPGTARTALRVLARVNGTEATPVATDSFSWDHSARWRSRPAPLPVPKPELQPTLF